MFGMDIRFFQSGDLLFQLGGAISLFLLVHGRRLNGAANATIFAVGGDVFRLDLSQQREQGALVNGLHRLAPKEGQTVDIGRRQHGKDLLLCFGGKGLTVAEIPGLRLETAGAVIAAAGDEQGHPNAGAVGHVDGTNVRVVHLRSPGSCRR